jgi:uncharacterized delta-60 repeat protein
MLALAAVLLWGVLSAAPAGAILPQGLRGKDVGVDAEGNLFVFATDTVGTTESCVLRKYSPAGKRIWSRQLTANCEAAGIDIARDGTLALAATLDTETASDIWLARYSARGEKIWAKTVNVSSADSAKDVAVAPDGSIYVTGYSYLAASSTNIWTAKYSASGVRRWARTYVTVGQDSGYGVAVAPDGGVYVTGNTGPSLTLWLRRYGPTGGVKWTRTFLLGSFTAGKGIAVAPDGSIYVTGLSSSFGFQDLLLVKYLPTGALKWSRTYNGAANGGDSGNRVAVAPNGTVYVAGYSTVNSLTSDDILAAAYTPAGVRKWSVTFNGPANAVDQGTGVAVAPDGSAVFTGYVARTSRHDLWVKRIQSMD